MKTSWLCILCILILAAGACTGEIGDAGDFAATDASGEIDAPGEIGASGEPALPPSLLDTEPDGTLHTDARGRFVADDDAMRFFDYYLTAEGELGEDALHDLVHQSIRSRLPAPAADEAVEAFERYLLYRAEAAAIMDDQAQTVDTARDRMVRLHAELVPDIPGLARDPILFHRAAALHHVLADSSLDRQMRRARMAAIEARFAAEAPDDARVHQATRLPLRLRDAELRLRARGGSDADVQALRVDMVGPAAAARLRSLDAERARWQQRVHAYREQAVQAPQASNVSSSGAPHFSPRELLRLRALERIAEEPAVSSQSR